MFAKITAYNGCSAFRILFVSHVVIVFVFEKLLIQ